MNLRAMLAGVREREYLYSSGKDQPAQGHLRDVKRQLTGLVPAGMRVLVSGSGQSLPVVPWIAVLDPDVTTTAQEGLYVVYLYRRDLSRVYLSMNQGTTQHLRNAIGRGLVGKSAHAAALEELANESTALRERLSESVLAGLFTKIDLGAPNRFLPQGYEVGNIAAVEYDLMQLPDDAVLREDLTRMIAVYSSCVDIKNSILTTEPGRLQTTAAAAKAHQDSAPKPSIFRPKSSAAYTAEVKAHSQKRSRRHEGLLTLFYEWMKDCKLESANNVHPRDLTVDGASQHWLIEAKTVRTNAEQAVREAIGQLFSYRHFYYREQGRSDPALVALFSEPVGAAFPPLLNSLGIESIWQDGQTWDGSAPDAATSLLRVAKLNQAATT